MGVGCTRGSQAAAEHYDINSTKILDHFTLGETLGRGAFGVVKVATMKPSAIKAINEIQDLSTVPNNIARRRRFANQALAVKVMRQEKNSVEGDSCERLEAQINMLDLQVADMEKSMSSNSMQGLEELQWLNEYTESLKTKLLEKRRSQTKKTPRDMMLREVSLLEKCHHQFIMQLVETFEDNNLFCVVFERCYGSVVTRYPDGVLNVAVVARQSYQLLSAVQYVHGCFILHRDIKPENLMFRSANAEADVLLGDFGMAVELRKMEDRCQGCAGTPHFVPPEGFHSYYQSFPSDVWACGCTVYWMLLGQCPFEVTEVDVDKRSSKTKGGAGKSFQTTAIFNIWRSTRMGQVLGGWKPQFEHDQTAILARKICHPNAAPSFTYQSGQALNNASIVELLTSMLCKDPKVRIKADAALKHSWIFAAKEEAEGNKAWSGQPSTSRPAASPDGQRLDKIIPVS